MCQKKWDYVCFRRSTALLTWASGEYRILIQYANIRIRVANLNIAEIVKNVKACQLTNAGAEKNPSNLFRGRKPRAYWETDLTAVKTGKFGHRYLLVFMDMFSGWTEAFLIKH